MPPVRCFRANAIHPMLVCDQMNGLRSCRRQTRPRAPLAAQDITFQVLSILTPNRPHHVPACTRIHPFLRLRRCKSCFDALKVCVHEDASRAQPLRAHIDPRDFDIFTLCLFHCVGSPCTRLASHHACNLASNALWGRPGVPRNVALSVFAFFRVTRPVRSHNFCPFSTRHPPFRKPCSRAWLCRPRVPCPPPCCTRPAWACVLCAARRPAAAMSVEALPVPVCLVMRPKGPKEQAQQAPPRGRRAGFHDSRMPTTRIPGA